jgi:hypothetical protein
MCGMWSYRIHETDHFTFQTSDGLLRDVVTQPTGKLSLSYEMQRFVAMFESASYLEPSSLSVNNVTRLDIREDNTKSLFQVFPLE